MSTSITILFSFTFPGGECPGECGKKPGHIKPFEALTTKEISFRAQVY